MASDGSVKISAEFDTDKAVSSMSRFAKMAKNGLNIVGHLGKMTMGAIAGVEAGLTAAGAIGIRYNAQMEQYMASFGTLLGDQEKAVAHMEDLKQFAAKTPFEMPGIADASRTLLSVGVENEKVMGILKQLGDVSLGNQEKFSSLALVYGQVASQGKLMGQDLLQCINAGFNPLQVISEHTGQSMAELKKQMSEGAVSAEMVAQAFAWATEEGGMFHDGLQKQSETFDGLMSTLKDNAVALAGEVVKPVSESMTKELLPAAISTIEEMSEAYQKDGLEGLADATGEAFADIITRTTSYVPKMTKVSVDFIKAFIRGIRNNKGEIKAAAADLAKTFMNELLELLPESVREPVRKMVDEIVKSFKSSGIRNAGEYVAEIFREIGDVSLKVGKAALPVFTKSLKFCADHLDVLVPLAVAYFTAMKSYTVLQKAAAAVGITTKAWQAAATAVAKHEAAQRLNTAVSLGGTTLMQTAVALLTGKITLAAAAQWAWNAAMNASPFGVMATAIGAVIGAATVAAAAINRTKTATEELEASNEKLAESYSGIGEQASKFREGIEQAGTVFDQFNDSIIISSEKQQELADTMDSIQRQITDITGTYVEERRNLTESEIAELDRLFEKMHEQAALELEMQQAYQTATQERARILAETHQGTAEEYAAASQSIINTAEQTRATVIEKAEEQLNEELALLELRMQKEEGFTQDRYHAEAIAAQQRYDSAIEAANKEHGDTLAIISEGFSKRAGALQESNERIAELRAQEIQENQRYNEKKAALEKELQEVSKKTGETDYQRQSKLSYEIFNLKDEHEKKIAKLHEKMSKTMDEESQKQAGILMELSAETELYGGEIQGKTKEMVNSVIDSFQSLPEPAKQAAEDAMEGMLEGLRSREGELYDKAESIANNIIHKLRKAFDEHSPSKVTKKIFRYVMDGGIIGLSEKEKEMYSKVGNIAEKIKNLFSISSEEIEETVRRMYGAVAEHSGKISRNGIYQNDPRQKDPDDREHKQDYAEMAWIIAEAVVTAMENLEFKVDDREFARLVWEAQ